MGSIPVGFFAHSAYVDDSCVASSRSRAASAIEPVACSAAASTACASPSAGFRRTVSRSQKIAHCASFSAQYAYPRLK